MPLTSVPKYPVVDPSPKFEKIVMNFNIADFGKIGAFSAAGYVFGWFSARKPFRGPQSKFLAGLGLVSGISYASLSSLQRFMGLEPNAYEIKKYGAMSDSELEIKIKQMNTPNLQLIDETSD